MDGGAPDQEDKSFYQDQIANENIRKDGHSERGEGHGGGLNCAGHLRYFAEQEREEDYDGGQAVLQGEPLA